jgi:C-terminal processing protease CtpA/Prc
VILFATLAGCSAFLPAEPSDDPVTVFEAAWTDMDELYGNFDLRAVDWDAAWEKWSPQVGSDSSDDELREALTGMLAITDDGHVQMLRPGDEPWSANAVFRDEIGDDRFDLDVVVDHYLSDVDDSRNGAVWGTLADGTPYIHFAFVAQNMKALDDVLDAHEDADAIAIDMRHNGGGDFTWAFQNFGVLTGETTPVFRSRTRNGPDRDAFTEWTTWSLEPRGEHRELRIVLLTDRFAISAGERAAMALQALPDTVTLGEPTNGSFATMIGRELPNRWGLALPVQEVLWADRDESPEGIGLPVDETILNDPTDLEGGTDAVLDRALQILGED